MGYRYPSDVELSLKRNHFTRNFTRVPEYGREVERLTEFADQRFVLVEEGVRLEQMGERAEQEFESVKVQKVHLREEEAKSSESVEQKFYAVIQEIRDLDKWRER